MVFDIKKIVEARELKKQYQLKSTELLNDINADGPFFAVCLYSEIDGIDIRMNLGVFSTREKANIFMNNFLEILGKSINLNEDNCPNIIIKKENKIEMSHLPNKIDEEVEVEKVVKTYLSQY